MMEKETTTTVKLGERERERGKERRKKRHGGRESDGTCGR